MTFSMANDPEEWRDFHFSKVVYGADKREPFKKLSLLLKKVNADKKTMEVDLGKLYAFHKSLLFQYEQEVRLLFDHRQKRVG